MQIAVILINWNQSETTIRCIQSLLANQPEESEGQLFVVVVDNHSHDDELARIETYILQYETEPIIYLIKNDRNAGFAGGNNVGIRHALEHYRPDYIWLLNNDVIVQPNALTALIRAARKYPAFKIWGSTIYELQPHLHFHCAGGFRYNALLSIPTPITFPPPEKLPTGLYYPLPEMDYPAGVSMFVKADVFRTTGLMNETYFLFYEELDLVHQIGGKWHIGWCPDSILHHQSGKSTGSKDPNKGQGSHIAHYHGNLSALKYTWRYHPLYLPVVFIFRLFVKSILFLRHRDYRAFRPLYLAYADFLRWLFAKAK
ncbi:MAG: glycosyltransferase family 2 protein [Saprospiraceae bacterium]|nr:glycosyltransferase family 2 protein [Lewinella sp.]